MYDDPSLIVLDEPNSNLDDLGERALVEAINDLKGRGKTIILITHRTSALSTTHKLLLLRDGMAQLFGPSDQVLAEIAKLQQSQQSKQPKQGDPAQQPKLVSPPRIVADKNPGKSKARP